MGSRHGWWLALVLALVAGCSQAAGTPPPSSSTIPAPSPSAAPSEGVPSAAPSPSAGASAPPSAAISLLPGEPDPRLTPGATNPDVTQATIGSTICVSGWTATVRPPSSYTTGLKREQIAQYGYSDTNLANYEEDHLIPLELGGAPADAQNLWPEPYTVSLADGTSVGARVKDQLENKLKSLVCAGSLPLAEAQRDIATDWVGAWIAYVGGGAEASVAPPTTSSSPLAASTSPSAGTTGLTVSITSVTSPVGRGSKATLVAETAPAAACSIVVRYKSGPSSAQGLGPASADATGSVSWTWTVGSRTTPGTWPITVACSAGGTSATAETSFVVE